VKECTLYIKPERNTCVYQKKVLLSDVAKVECEKQDVLRKVKNIVVHNFDMPLKDGKLHTTVSVSVLKVIKLIHEICPGALVINEGETDFVVEYQKSHQNKFFLDKVKTIFLCIVIFFGSAFSIMAFNKDINIGDIFDRFYEQVTGNVASGMNELEVCYCIGLALGIVVFFNHVGPKKITHDPTPIQVEMRKYEIDLDTTFIENASRKEHNIDVD